jgi:hypothetical protein
LTLEKFVSASRTLAIKWALRVLSDSRANVNDQLGWLGRDLIALMPAVENRADK